MEAALAIEETPEGYVLKRGTAFMPLSVLELMNLLQSAESLRARAMARLQPSGSGAEAVVSTIVAGASSQIDFLGENVLLALRAPNGGQTIYSIEPEKAVVIADELYRRSAQLGHHAGPAN